MATENTFTYSGQMPIQTPIQSIPSPFPEDKSSHKSSLKSSLKASFKMINDQWSTFGLRISEAWVCLHAAETGCTGISIPKLQRYKNIPAIGDAAFGSCTNPLDWCLLYHCSSFLIFYIIKYFNIIKSWFSHHLISEF